MSYAYEFPRPALTVDCVVFGLDEKGLKVLLIQRGLPPFEGRWALPGGFVRIEETLEQAAIRELSEETGLLPDNFTLRQLQHLYEVILDRVLDKRNLRKRILAMDILVELDDFETDVPHRAARLYRFDRTKYRRLTRQGFHFEV